MKRWGFFVLVAMAVFGTCTKEPSTAQDAANSNQSGAALEKPQPQKPVNPLVNTIWSGIPSINGIELSLNGGTYTTTIYFYEDTYKMVVEAGGDVHGMHITFGEETMEGTYRVDGNKLFIDDRQTGELFQGVIVMQDEQEGVSMTIELRQK